jgi:hypothetical protein
MNCRGYLGIRITQVETVTAYLGGFRTETSNDHLSGFPQHLQTTGMKHTAF